MKICNSTNLSVKKGVSNNINIVLEDLPYNFLSVNSNYQDNISIYIYCNKDLEAPLPANSNIGYLTVTISNKTVLTLNIYNSNAIMLKSPMDFYKTFLMHYTYYLESAFY